jgi:hypothetical protein
MLNKANLAHKDLATQLRYIGTFMWEEYGLRSRYPSITEHGNRFKFECAEFYKENEYLDKNLVMEVMVSDEHKENNSIIMHEFHYGQLLDVRNFFFHMGRKLNAYNLESRIPDDD